MSDIALTPSHLVKHAVPLLEKSQLEVKQRVDRLGTEVSQTELLSFQYALNDYTIKGQLISASVKTMQDALSSMVSKV